MPASDSSAIIVARFLKANNYTESYNAFISEAGLPEDAGDVSPNDLTIERILDEKKLYDKSVNFEKLNLSDATDKGWSQPAPSTGKVVETLPARANVLNVSIERTIAGNRAASLLLLSTSDRRLSILDVPACNLHASWPTMQDSPILSHLILEDAFILTASMSGKLVIADLAGGDVIESRRDHSKYIVKIVSNSDAADPLIATAGWDDRVNVYAPLLDKTTPKSATLRDPIAVITLPTKPESLFFARHPQSKQPVLVISRTDSSHLHFWTVEESPRLLGRQNLAPDSNAWVAFTPSSLAVCPTDPSLVAVATRSSPHMKLIVSHLLFPPFDSSSTSADPAISATASSQARAELAVADKEHDAIKLHCNTMSGQTPYSTPQVVWRPDGSGVWVNGDDGLIRGIDVKTGKVVSTLRGHDPGSKVRTLWAGYVGVGDGGEKEEWLVSGGFDQKLIVWKP